MGRRFEAPSNVVVKERRSVSVLTANLVGLPFLLGVLVLFLGLHGWIWDVSVLDGLLAAYREQEWPLVTIVIGLVAHEALHVLAMWAVGGVPWSEIEGGMNWRLLTPYVHTSHVQTARAYRIVSLSPGVILGLFPAAVGIGSGSMFLTLYGALLTGVAGGDVLSVWCLRGVASDAWILDSRDRCGGEVVVPAPADRQDRQGMNGQ